MTMLTFRSSKSTRESKPTSGLRRLVSLIGLVLLIASVIRELRLPAERRTWHGYVFGKVPYDLRVPSLARLATTMWNPHEQRLVVPTAIGVGWTINFAALRTMVASAAGR
jgi:uncharacterized protein DUF5808